VLQWARENGCPWDSQTFRLAANVEIVQWLRANGCPETYDYNESSDDSEYGNENNLFYDSDYYDYGTDNYDYYSDDSGYNWSGR
jgi:hypothetical protein